MPKKYNLLKLVPHPEHKCWYCVCDFCRRKNCPRLSKHDFISCYKSCTGYVLECTYFRHKLRNKRFKINRRLNASINIKYLERLRDSLDNILIDFEPEPDPYEGMTPQQKFHAMARELKKENDEKERKMKNDGE